jgi:hypothetical protein
VKREMKLVHGLGIHLGTTKRMILYALAFDAHCGGIGMASERRLQNGTELGARVLKHFLRELETEGWITREGECFTLSLSKMEANQRSVLSANRIALGEESMSTDQNECLRTP